MHYINKRLKAVPCFAVIACCCLISGSNAGAGQITASGNESSEAIEGTRAVKVILTNYADAGYVIESEAGLSGYYVDYLKEIAQYTGWHYDFHVVATESELIEYCENQEYDLMIGVDYTKEADERYFDYSSVPMGARHLVLATDKAHPDLHAEDVTTLLGARIGAAADAYNEQISDRFENYCINNGLEFTLDSETPSARGLNVVTVERDKCFELLKSGELDAIIITDSFALEEELYVVESFGRIPIYGVEPNGRNALIPDLEMAIKSIRSQDPDYEEKLYEQYFGSNNVNYLSFNEQEKAFLNDSHSYKVALWKDCAPYAYLNEQGEWSGVVVSVFEQISEMTEGKLSFEIVGFEDSFEANEALNQKQVDILGITFSSLRAAERGNRRSRSFWTDSFYMYRNQSSVKSLEDASIVVKKDVTDAMLQELGVKNLDNITYVDSVVDALKLVDSGRADITFAMQNVAEYYMNFYQLNRMFDFDVQGNEISFCAVYGEEVEALAREICNKCIAHLDDAKIDRSITAYILQDHEEVQFKDYIRANRHLFASIAFIMLCVALALLSAVVIIIHRKSKRIYEMLYYDDITKGSSNLKFEQDVVELVANMPRQYYIIFADIHSFKYINDVFGYNVGNDVLCTVEKFFGDLTAGNPFARMYADHFVGIRPYEERVLFEDKLQQALEDFAQEMNAKYTEFNVFLKIGIYLWDSKDGMEIRQAVNLANYAADSLTNLSLSEYCTYTMEMHDKILKRQRIERDMHRALEAGEFIAYYQPKYDIVSNRIIGAEALVRWKHKTKGLISPGEFVPIFETNGFIIEIDLCVFEQVCSFLTERKHAGKQLYPISCNFSRRHFSNEDLVEKLMRIVDRYDVAPEYIEIEITETVATSDFDKLLHTVKLLKEKGFQIAIDDFGSGYSCIQLLYKLPIDVLKLDRVFVMGQNAHGTEEDVNRSIVNICHNHGIKVICEGVETQQQKEFVENYGCRYIQGFLYSKPVELEQFIDMLSREN